jgi:hypothetical protein
VKKVAASATTTDPIPHLARMNPPAGCRVHLP